MRANIYELALSYLPAIGKVGARLLIQQFGSAEKIFRAPLRELEQTEGIGKVRAKIIKEWDDFKTAEEELAQLEALQIRAFFLTHPEYPRRLLHCYDPPTVLYYRGNCDLNTDKTVSIVGTRNNSRYGKALTEELVRELSRQHVLVISGLAYGTDAAAHESAIRNNLETVAVMASGADIVYPPEHYSLSKKILEKGALVTEFKPGIFPEKHHFPGRNRIVAGMADATIVIETGEKGGSMITAELAVGYHRDVFAFPGRVNDEKSKGCNLLIARQQAQLVRSAEDVIQAMNWEIVKSTTPIQPSFFPDLNEEENNIFNILTGNIELHADVISAKTGCSPARISALLLQLEMKGIVASLPGKRYRLRPP